jgi:hypothetical protein
MKIATGEIAESEREAVSKAAAAMGRKGGAARAQTLSKATRRAIAKKAAAARWQLKNHLCARLAPPRLW